MAAIGEIRKRSTLLLIVIGLALLAFILGDLFTTLMGSGRAEGDKVINGESITQDEFNLRSVISSTGNMTSEQLDYFWTSEILMNREIEKIGLETTEKEIELRLKSPDSLIVDPSLGSVPDFQDANGNFSAEKAKAALQKLEEQGKENPQAIEQLNNIRRSLKEIGRKRPHGKYAKLVEQGLYATHFEAKKNFNQGQQTKSISYVYAPYTSVTDEEVNLTDDYLKAYYEKHKNDFNFKNRANSVKYRYVTYEVQASERDHKTAKNKVEALAPNFEAQTEFTQDSAFVMYASDVKQANRIYQPLPQMFIKDSSELEKGKVLGPIQYNGGYSIAKIVSTADRKANTRHILIGHGPQANGRTKEQAKALADSLLVVVQNDKSKFGDIVMMDFTQNSPGTKNEEKRGELGYTDPKSFVKPYADYMMNNPVGSMAVVESQFGFHVIEILGFQETPNVQCAIITKKVAIGMGSRNKAKTAAEEEFIINTLNNEDLDFNGAATKLNKPISDDQELYKYQQAVSGLNESEALANWIHTSNAGDISEPIYAGDKNGVGQIVIVEVIKKKLKGVADFEDVKTQMEAPAKNELKAKVLINKVGSASSVEDAASKLGITVSNASVKFNENNIKGAGNDPNVIGAIYGKKHQDGSFINTPLEGKSGIYYVKINTTSAVADSDYSATQKSLTEYLRRAVNSTLTRALYEKAELEGIEKQ